MAQQVEQLRADGVYKEVLREGTGPLPDFRDGTKVRDAPPPPGLGGGEGWRGGGRERRARRACAMSSFPHTHTPGRYGDAAAYFSPSGHFPLPDAAVRG